MLDSLIDTIEGGKRRCTVYRGSEPTDIERWLRDRGVVVESRPLPPGGPDPFVELEADGEVVGVVGVESIEELTTPPIVRPEEGDGTSEGYRVLFEMLERTVLSGMRRRTLLAVSREIEDRAFRVGTGTLRVGFQTLSAFRAQTDVYRTLGTETGLDIHVYGVADWLPPAVAGVTYHADGTGRLEPYWVLAYDGGPDRTRSCGLVARERSDGYTGFWTDDPATVEGIAAAFETV